MFGNNLQSVDAIVSGELSGNINSIYQDIINNDIVKPSYSDFSRPETFGLVKRRAYKNIFANWDFAQYRITDMAFIPMWNCWEDGYTLYFYTVSPDNTEFRIFKVPMTVEGQIYCINTFINEIATTCHCPCQADNFIKVKWPRGERRPIPDGWGDITSNNGVQVNRTNTTTNITEGRFGEGTYGTFEPRVAGVNYNIWDYVYVYCITWLDDPTKGIAGQVRQIIGYDWATNELILDFPRNLTPDNVLSTALSTGYAASYSVFSEWWEVLVFASCEWLYSLHPVEDEEAILPICDSNTTNDACITTLNYHNGQIHYTNDRGRDVYSETGQNQFAFEGTNVSPVPNAILNQVSFRNHLVYFSYSTIWVLYPTTSNNEAYASVWVSETVGLWSRYSFVADDNQLLIVTNQRRLKALSIIQNKDSQPEIKLEDITSYFNGELDNLEFGDQVYINKVGKELRIHIVGRQTADDNETIEKRTKILILDTEYNVYHKHTVCNWEVTTYLGYWLYGGSGVFSRCGYEDGGMPDEEWDMVGTKYYTQTISTILGQNWFPALEFNTFNPKRLKYLKTMLWPSILTNWDSEVKYISNRNGMKPERVMNDWENITWIDAWNRIKAGEQIPVSLCFTDDLQECETLNDSCPNGIEPEPEPTICNCPTEYKNQSNYCNCYVNPWYFLADIYPLEIKRITNFAETIKVEWNAKQGNSMYFMWFAALVEKGQIIDDVYDNNNLENENCCARPEIFYTNSNGDEYTCGQPLIGWNPVQGSASYQVKEGATILWTNTDPEFQISGATAWNHTYTILAYDWVEYYEIGSVLINILLTCLPLAPETFTLDPEYDCGDPTVLRSDDKRRELIRILFTQWMMQENLQNEQI
jgi:hypothetical protein